LQSYALTCSTGPFESLHTTAHPGGEIRGQLILKAGLGHDRDEAGHVEHDDADDDE